ncbi:MAG: hypothetical protein A2021_01200 [Elusimicrobia bacterium GWF2_52_66]|nr:MAG: hypothetical protein A2X33_06055 [Elusimicrobia bacterium GWA2_51_34]OGR88210.1 MAG: hypothetical protein A2021_01200 [Elusimicrobia bacterium GWF2_52_66]HAF95415.1 hypothetical protein [Elusimicrobiota bacterium]HCE98721.1 hypothetical protein [Elusimicrobiota bacterium]
MTKRDAVLEILIENIPVRFILPAEEQFKALAYSLMEEAGLPFYGIETCATCRRLVIYIRQIPARCGNRYPGKSAVDALRSVFAGAISGLKFPTTMLWGEESIPFVRPIRGLLALYGDKAVVFDAAGLTSGRSSVTISANAPFPINVPSAETYFKTLKNYGILVKDKERMALLRRTLTGFARRASLRCDMDEDLLRENLYMAERPVCVFGEYSKDFLRLPPELIILVIKKQLKLFPLHDRKNRLKPFFLAITDGISKGRHDISNGFRNTAEARLRGAVFLYSRDLSAEPRTARITFAGRLGACLKPLRSNVRRRLENMKKLGF